MLDCKHPKLCKQMAEAEAALAEAQAKLAAAEQRALEQMHELEEEVKMHAHDESLHAARIAALEAESKLFQEAHEEACRTVDALEASLAESRAVVDRLNATVARLKAAKCERVFKCGQYEPVERLPAPPAPARPACKPTEECKTAGCEASEACAPARPAAEWHPMGGGLSWAIAKPKRRRSK